MRKFANKKVVSPLLMVFIITLSMFAQAVLAQSSSAQTSIALPSIGLISYPSLPLPNPSEILPLTGFGGDYLVTFAGGEPDEVWLDWGWGDIAASRLPYYQTSKLCFVFSGLDGSSVLEYEKMDRVLEIFASHGLKVIPVLMQHTDEVSHYVAQQGFVDDWVEFANYYKNSPLRSTIAALHIFGEPGSVTLGDFPSKLALQQRWAYTIQQIHAVDPTMPVIFPNGDQIYLTAEEHISDILATGITSDPYVIYDTSHPYYFPPPYDIWNNGLSPEQKAEWYIPNWVQPYIDVFGAGNCWVGETFFWGTNDPEWIDLQSRWLTAIINELYAIRVGFSVWSSLGVGGTEGWVYNINAVDNSNYNGVME